MVFSRLKKPEDADSAREEKSTDNEQIINMVNGAVNSITSRLNGVAFFDGPDSKVKIFKKIILMFVYVMDKWCFMLQIGNLVAAADNHDNLCRMDPAWHPWL